MRKQSGITMIALVVTIVVLLILSSVSIGLIIADNGLIERSTQATQGHKESNAKEQATLAIMTSLTDKEHTYSKDKAKEEIEKINGASVIDQNDGTLIAIIDGIKVAIDGEGNVSIIKSDEESDIITAGEKAIGNNKRYIDGDKTAIIPKNFTVSNKDGETSINKGLVIIAPDNSEFVWVPVDKESLQVDGIANKEIAKKQEDDNQYYEGILYDFPDNKTESNQKVSTGIGKAGNREPSLITGSTSEYSWKVNNPTAGSTMDAAQEHYKTILNFETVQEFGISLNNEYTSIINSIKQNGGYYVGRYETSYNDGKIQSIINGTPLNATVESGNKWYGMYQKQQNYAKEINNDKIYSTMIYGSLYDGLLNWALYSVDGTDKNKVTADSTIHEQGLSGSDPQDVIKNVYDLGNNLLELTAEARSTGYRIIRGGCSTSNKNPSYRSISYSNSTSTNRGTRMIITIK